MRHSPLIFLLLIIPIFFCTCSRCHGGLGNANAFIYIEGSGNQKVGISYYDLGDKTDSVNLPYYNTVSANTCYQDRFYLKICSTATSVRAIIYTNVPMGGDSCGVQFIIDNKVNSRPLNPNISSSCYKITTDSVFKYLKSINYKGYLETNGNTGCTTVTPN